MCEVRPGETGRVLAGVRARKEGYMVRLEKLKRSSQRVRIKEPGLLYKDVCI